MKKPIIKREWETIKVYFNDAVIEADFNRSNGEYYLSSPRQDCLVSFKSEDKDISVSLDKAKCVITALEHIKKELNL